MTGSGRASTRAGTTPCVILAGGRGTRLQERMPGLPKVLAPVAGRPFLEHLLRWLARQGFSDVILCTGHLGEQIAQPFGNGRALGLRLHYSQEDKPLGTGGALKRAEPLLAPGDSVVLNGDSYLATDLNCLLEFHRSRQALATLALVEVPDTRRYGAVGIDPEGTIVAFGEKQKQGPGLINGGVYVLHPRLLAQIGPGPSSLEQDVLPRLIGRQLYGMRAGNFFVDIGTPESYGQLQSDPSQFLESVYGPERE